MESQIGETRLTGIISMTTTPKPRRIHDKEFKQDAVRLAASIGVRRVAADLGIGESMLYEWRKLSQKEGDGAIRGNGNHPAIAAELALLRRENEVLKMEREILKKAAEFWVKERQ